MHSYEKKSILKKLENWYIENELNQDSSNTLKP